MKITRFTCTSHGLKKLEKMAIAKHCNMKAVRRRTMVWNVLAEFVLSMPRNCYLGPLVKLLTSKLDSATQVS